MQRASQHRRVPEIKRGKYTGRVCRAPKVRVIIGLLTPIKTGTQGLFVLQHLRELEPARNSWTSLSTVCFANLLCTANVFVCLFFFLILKLSFFYFSHKIISPETPDAVAIRRVDNSSVVLEKREFQLQCDITNVAPARSLAVQWYRGNETVELRGKGWTIILYSSHFIHKVYRC